MEIIKNLYKSIVDRNIGFNRREDLDFTDDGTKFRGYDYKGLPITTCRSNDKTYLCIRHDRVDKCFTWDEWNATSESKLCDEFNGVDEVDLDKLIDNCEKVLAKIDELNATLSNEQIDMTAVKERAKFERQMLAPLLEKAKSNIRWWELGQYDFKCVADSIKGAQDMMWSLGKNYDCLSRVKKKLLVEKLEKYGYIELPYTGAEYYTKRLIERLY